MKFTDGWEDDWHIESGDKVLAGKLLPIFEAYLKSLQKKGVAKSTFNRHKSACHAIGGYIIDRVFHYQWDKYKESEQGEDILLRYLDGYDGPLIHQDNESWQREVDTTSRKLYTFIKNLDP